MDGARPTLAGMPSLFLLALLSIDGWPSPPPHTRMGLAFDARLPEAVVRAAVQEANALWRPYGVAVVQLPCSPIDGLVDAGLTVRIAEPSARAAQAWSSPFGSIRFLPGGEPEPAIALHYEAVVSLGLQTVTIRGTRESQWPSALRTTVLGRMVGRVIAHEIGHWLLRSKEHSPSGLMRAFQPASELADPGRERFALTPDDVKRLQLVRAR